MKVISLRPEARGVRVVVCIEEASASGPVPKIMLYETQEFSAEEERPPGLAQLRTRIRTLLESQQPDVVFVDALEPQAVRAFKKFINVGWFEAAEVRGVVCETAHSCGCRIKLRTGAEVTRAMGTRKGKEYLKDEKFWKDAIVGNLPKAYREAALLGISFIRGGQ